MRGTRVLSTRQKNRLPAERFAFTNKRKEPITDARHVRNAIARFDQVEGVTDADRDAPGSAFGPVPGSLESRSARVDGGH